MELLDDKYRIERLLGAGGMGAVYQATHLGTKRTVAVKVIHPQLSNYEEFVTRFRREAEAAGRLRHPNVVDVTDFGFHQTNSGLVAYLVMEYLDGCTLAEVLAEERRLPITWVVDILEQVCSAVDEAHRLGIIHRDLKPDNIWLEPNRRGGYTVKVLDFGLVKLAESDPLTEESTSGKESSAAIFNSPNKESETLLRPAVTEDQQTLLKDTAHSAAVGSGVHDLFAPVSSRVDSNGRLGKKLNQETDASSALATPAAANLTRVGSVMGTPFYMSPEQCRGELLDSRSDIYSLGVVAYRMLAGETPFTGTIDELIELHKTAAPGSIREKNRKVPRRMARIVMSALAKNPADRPDSAAGFASAMRTSVEGTGQLLRHGIALYSEHLPVFLKISLLAYAPLIVVLAFANLSDYVIDMQRLSPFSQMFFGMLLFLAMLVSSLLAYFSVSAAAVPLVVQLIVAPLRPVRIATTLAPLKRRWLTLVTTSLLVMTMILLGTALFVVPGALAAITYALYVPVVIMEGLGVRATLRRARSLSRRAWTTVLTITVLQFTLPLLVWHAAISTTFTLKLGDDYRPQQFGFSFSMSGRSAFYQLFNIFVTPLTAIMISLLYLKTRQAGGESLKDASEQFEALDIPRSKWQARIRSRSVSMR